MALRFNPKQLLLFIATVAIYIATKAVFVVYIDVEVVDFGPEVTRGYALSPVAPSGDMRRHTTTEDTHAHNRRTGSRSAEVAANKSEEERRTENQYSLLYNGTSCPVDQLGLSENAVEVCAGVRESPNTCKSLLTCRSLLTGTGNDVARKLMSGQQQKSIPDTWFINVTSDCGAFKRQRGYHLTPLSVEEAEFPVAFTILVHTNVDQVERQLRALYRPQNLFCIHVDAKAPREFTSAISSIASCFPNVFIASRRETLTWGGYNRLQADINCMKDHLNSSSPWKYLINTAGLAFPLKTIGEMVKVLKIYNGVNDIEGIYGGRVIKSRFEKEWVEDPIKGTVKDTGRKNPKPPHEIDIVRGSAYGIFSRGFVRFIVNDQRAIDLLTWSRKTWSPDELYWATLHHTYSNPHLHTPGGFSGYPSDKPWLAVYANWDAGSCHGMMVRGVCVFGVADLPLLVKRREFFANKFYQNNEPLALECLAAWIRQKEICPPKFDFEYYQSLPFVKPQSPKS